MGAVAQHTSAVDRPLLEIVDLRVDILTAGGTVHAVRGVDLEIDRGEIVGLVGESGCGKSLTALSVLGLQPRAKLSGSITFGDRDLLRLKGAQRRRVRGREIAMIFQDPLSSLNPVLTIGRQLREAVEVTKGLSRRAASIRAGELLEMVGIHDPDRRLRQYPHEFSGGMRQRVMIAAALAGEPALLIADEPTTALDVTVQAEILDLLGSLRKKTGTSILLITHDLGVVAGLADRVNVMYAGRIVERAETEQLLASPQHPYTGGLLRAVPRLDRPREERLESIEGSPPDLASEISGCSFRDRCRYAFERCETDRPELFALEHARAAACWLTHRGSDDDAT